MTRTALPSRLRLIALALAATVAVGIAPAQAGDSGVSSGKHNRATARVTSAGSSRFDLAIGARETRSNVIDEKNTASAYARCVDCRGVAIAFQLVVVQSRPKRIVPENLAVAVNDGCKRCSTLAIAYQFVVGRGEPVEVTGTGRRRLAEIYAGLNALEDDYRELSDDAVRVRADAYAAQVREVLDSELVARDDGRRSKEEPRVDREERGEG